MVVVEAGGVDARGEQRVAFEADTNQEQMPPGLIVRLADLLNVAPAELFVRPPGTNARRLPMTTAPWRLP